jgi:hypothetical protein
MRTRLKALLVFAAFAGCSASQAQQAKTVTPTSDLYTLSLVAFVERGSAQTGNMITPLIFTKSGGNYVVTGVGATETITVSGPQTFNFVLTDGSALVGASTYFGYRDGTVSTGSGTAPGNDTIAFSAAGSGALIQYFGSASYGTSPNIFVGESFNPGGTTVAGGPEPGGLAYSSSQLPRIYSLNATDSAVPEPGTIALMLGGGIAIWAGRRKRA